MWPFGRGKDKVHDECALELLAQVYHAAVKQRDRIGSTPFKRIDYGSGLPFSANDLAAPGHQLRGEQMVLQMAIIPDRVARDVLGLIDRDPIDWTEKEAQLHAALVDRVSDTLEKWRRKGWVVFEAPIIVNPGLDAPTDGRIPAMGVRPTRALIAEAKKVIPRHANLANRPLSPLWGMTPAARRAAPQWAQKEFVNEGGSLDGEVE